MGGTSWAAPESPKRASMRLKTASEIAPATPRWLKIVPDTPLSGPKTAPRRLLVATEPPEEASTMPKSVKHLMSRQTPNEFYVFRLLALSLAICFLGFKMVPKWPKRAPREAQERSKSAPRAP